MRRRDHKKQFPFNSYISRILMADDLIIFNASDDDDDDEGGSGKQ